MYIFYFQETIGIIHLLDPEGKGRINFQEFCKGVQEVLEVQGKKIKVNQLLQLCTASTVWSEAVISPPYLGLLQKCSTQKMTQLATSYDSSTNCI